MRTSVTAIVVAIVALVGCVRTGVGLVPYSCLHPENHRVDSERAAIVAARVAWYCAKPRTAKGSEDQWIGGYDAVVRGGSWRVSTKVPAGFVGGGLIIYVGRVDGQILDIKLIQ